LPDKAYGALEGARRFVCSGSAAAADAMQPFLKRLAPACHFAWLTGVGAFHEDKHGLESCTAVRLFRQAVAERLRASGNSRGCLIKQGTPEFFTISAEIDLP